MIKKNLLLLSLVLICMNANAGWTPMGTGLPGKVKALTVFNSSIYAGGEFSSPSHVAKWNGAAWEQVGNGLNGNVNALVVHNGSLYAGGDFTTDASGANQIRRIAVLNNSNNTWEEVGGGLTSASVNALLSDPSGLYVGGNFGVYQTTTVSRIALFNGSTWSQLGTVANSGVVNAIAKFNNEIYIGGSSAFFPNGVSKLAGGTTWSVLPGGLNGDVLTLAVFQNKLYLGGKFNSPGQFFSMYSGSGSIGTAVYALNPLGYLNALYSSPLKLFGGGAFTSSTSAGISLPHFFSVTFTGANNLSAEGSNFNGNINAITYLGGKVIVGGEFTQNGSSPMSRVAISDTTIDVQEISSLVVTKCFYPNPVTTNAVLKVTTNEIVNHPSLFIYDSQFRLINSPSQLNQNGKEIEFRIFFNSLASGQYFYSIIDENGQNLLVDKFLIE